MQRISLSAIPTHISSRPDKILQYANGAELYIIERFAQTDNYVMSRPVHDEKYQVVTDKSIYEKDSCNQPHAPSACYGIT